MIIRRAIKYRRWVGGVMVMSWIDDVVVMSWRRHGDGIVPCGEHNMLRSHEALPPDAFVVHKVGQHRNALEVRRMIGDVFE